MKKVISYAIAGFLLVLVLFTFWNYWHQVKITNDMVIADDIAELVEIFNTIHKECVIINFEHQKNNIDFLNVIAFEGSEVGPMNLKYPKKWQGAYLKDNPTVQEQYYQIVRTKKGYFVVPGQNVKLASGKVIGKDIMFDENIDLPALIKTDLQYNGRPLAAAIMIESTVSNIEQEVDSFKEKMARERLRGM